jgi:acetyltransferase
LDISPFENAIGRSSPFIRQNGKALLSSFVGMTYSKGKVLEGNFVPYYIFPEEAAPALANAVKYRQLKNQKIGYIPELKSIERDKARKLVNNILTFSSDRPLWISNKDVNELCKCYGIRCVATNVAETPEQAASVAAKIGFPVVVKLNSPIITHKTDVGGVMLDINTADDVKKAFKKIKDNLENLSYDNEMQGVIIQPQIREGVEVIIGVSEDPLLGHVIMFGMGGILADMMKDTALRLLPLTDIKAKDLINSVKISQLLKGYRGMKPCDIQSLEDLLLRISAMVEDIPQISEMDLNPVKVLSEDHGYWVVDSRIMIK